MDTTKYSIASIRVQGDRIMRCRVWNENLAAFFVTAPLAAPKPTIDAPVATPREGDAW